MAFDLNKQIGPFPLKIWLVIGAGGIGIGLFVASKQNSGKGVTSDKGIATPPQVFFSKVTIGLEHVPGVDEPVTAIKPETVNPIMPSNPAATKLPVTPQIEHYHPAYTAVEPGIWDSFTKGIPITAQAVAAANTRQQHDTTQPIMSGLDASGNAYF